MTVSGPTRRAWVALGLAEGLFAAVYPAFALAALRLPSADARDGWADLALFATLLVFGALAVVIGVPIAVHTVGRYTVHVSVEWSAARSAVAHLVVGLGVGALCAASLVLLGAVEFPAAAVACIAPAGVVALGTNLLMPFALRHRWFRVATWVLAAIPVALSLALGVSLAARNV